MKGQKVLLSLIQHQKSKNPVIRALTGTYVHLTIEKLGIGRALSDIKESFFFAEKTPFWILFQKTIEGHD